MWWWSVDLFWWRWFPVPFLWIVFCPQWDVLCRCADLEESTLLIYDCFSNELLAFSHNKCIYYRDYVLWYSLGIVIYFINSFIFESLRGFYLKLFEALGFNLHTFMCTDVICSVLCLLTECNNLSPYVPYDVSMMCLWCLAIFWTFFESWGLV